jgi:hypothetical protein
MAMICCPECRKPISETASACPGCGLTVTPDIVTKQKVKQRKSEQATARIVFGVVVVAVVLICWGGSNLRSAASKPFASDWSTIGYDRAGPIARAECLIKKQLRSPATASFPPSFDEYTVSNLGGGRWRVSGYVDAQNGFGANIRCTWTVTWQNIGDSRATIEELNIQ